ncbi:MAG: Maf family protein [Halioglobus sp.]
MTFDSAPGEQLILASASPRRSELLTQIGVSFRVEAADIDESVAAGEQAFDYVIRMAASKGAAVAGKLPTHIPVLAADTIVLVDGQVLGKPLNYDHAMTMLEQLSDRSHRVVTAVSLYSGGSSKNLQVETQVTFRPLSRQMCESYLSTSEPWDKAGGYGIQGLAGAFVVAIQGSYSNVVGLPLAETWQLLASHGVTGHLSGG